MNKYKSDLESNSDAIRPIDASAAGILTQLASNSYDPNFFLQRCREMLGALVEVSGSQFGFIVKVEHQFWGGCRASTLASTDTDLEQAQNEVHGDSDSLVACVMNTRKVVTSNNPYANEHSTRFPEGYPPLTSCMGVPMYFAGKMVGIICLANRVSGYDEEIIKALESKVVSASILVGSFVTSAGLAEAEYQYKESTQRAPALYLETLFIDNKSILVNVSDDFCELMGYARADLLNTRLSRLYDETSRSEMIADYESFSTVADSRRKVKRTIISGSGEKRHFLVQATTYQNVSGVVVGSRLVYNEVDEVRARSAQTALELRQFVDTANAPIFGIDPQGMVNEWNQMAETITGFTKSEVFGKNLVEEIIANEYKASVKQVFDDALAGKESANFELPLYTKANNRVEVLLNATTRRNASGKTVGVIGVGQDITLAKTAQEQTALELRQFVETANAPIFGIDAQGMVNEWNQMAESITGFMKSEVLGKNLVEGFITEEYKASVKQVFDRALRGTEATNFEFPLYTKGGRRVEVLLNATTRRSVDGSITGVIGVGQDITLAKTAQAQSEQTALELRQFVETANAPIFGIDPQGMVNEWNQMAETITGFTKSEVLGKNLVTEIIAKEYKKSVKEVFDRALLGTETANFELPLYTKADNRVEVLLNATTRRSVDGSIIGVIGVGQDITLAKTAQAQSEQTALELRQFVETANAPIFGIDAQGMVNEWNQMAETITDFTKSEVLGKNLVEEIIAQEYKTSVKHVFDEALAGKESANFEFPLYTKGGRRVEVLLNATTRRSVDGSIIGVIGVGQDITVLREQQLTVQRVQRTEVVGELTGGVAHDFNNLLTIIKGNLALLREDFAGMSTDQREILDDALSAASDGSRLTTQLLAFARRQNLQPIAVNVNELVQDTVRLAGRAIGENIELECSIDSVKPIAMVDPGQLESSLLNLCINSRDAMNNQGIIKIVISHGLRTVPSDPTRKDNFVSISVTDSGSGIDEDTLQRVFEPFFTTKETGKGSGLGLSMVQGFVGQSEGEVEIVSVVGQGTTITMYLPQIDSGIPDNHEEHSEQPGAQQNKTILIVEDEARVQKFAQRCARALGYDFMTADNVTEAIEVLSSDAKIDLIFSDIVMPGGRSGLDLQEYVLANFPNIGIQLTTGYADLVQLESQTPVMPLLKKPYTKTELGIALENLIESSVPKKDIK
jgi:PAS domain S-box-containing protein